MNFRKQLPLNLLSNLVYFVLAALIQWNILLLAGTGVAVLYGATVWCFILSPEERENLVSVFKGGTHEQNEPEIL